METCILNGSDWDKGSIKQAGGRAGRRGKSKNGKVIFVNIEYKRLKEIMEGGIGKFSECSKVPIGMYHRLNLRKPIKVGSNIEVRKVIQF